MNTVLNKKIYVDNVYRSRELKKRYLVIITSPHAEKRRTFCSPFFFSYAKAAAIFYTIPLHPRRIKFLPPLLFLISRAGEMRRSTRARKLHDFPLINLICTNRTDGTGRKKGTLRDSPWKWKIAGNGHATIRIAKSLCDIYHSRVSIVLSFTRNRNKEHLGSTVFRFTNLTDYHVVAHSTD